jgi:hypothetical protein
VSVHRRGNVMVQQLTSNMILQHLHGSRSVWYNVVGAVVALLINLSVLGGKSAGDGPAHRSVSAHFL